MRHLAKFLLLILTLGFLIFYTEITQASSECKVHFSENSFLALPSAHEAPLPKDVIDLIKSKAEPARHLEIQKIHPAPRGSGHDDFIERIPIGEGDQFVFGIAHLKDGFLYLGEHIAAQYIAKILKVLYPKATIEDGRDQGFNLPNIEIQVSAYEAWEKKHPHKHPVFIGIRDLQEKTSHASRDGIEMVYIKSANPGMAGVKPKSFRKRLGIPAEHFAVSLYFKDTDGIWQNQTKSPSFSTAIREISKSLHHQGKREPDLIFVSSGGARTAISAETLGPGLENYEVIKLSEWSTHYTPAKKFIVINDAQGRMPHILNVSDLAVVSGPINIMEPLTAGIPVIFFNNPETITAYNPEAFNKMAAQAKRTGGGYEVTSINEIHTALSAALNRSQPILPPYAVASGPEGSPTGMESLINHVIQSVEKALLASERVKEKFVEAQRKRN